MQEAKIRKLHEEHKKLHWKNGLEYPSFRSRIHKGWDTKKAVNTARQFDRKQTVWKEKVKVANHCNTEHPSFNTDFMWNYFKVSKEMMNAKTIRFWKNLFYSEKEVQKLLNDVNDKQSYDKQTIIGEFLSKILKERPNEIAIWNDDSEKVTYISSESVDDIMSKMKNSVLDDHAIEIVTNKPEVIVFADPRDSGTKPVWYWSEAKFEEEIKKIKDKYHLSIWRRFAISLLAAIIVIVAYSIASSINPLLFK